VVAVFVVSVVVVPLSLLPVDDALFSRGLRLDPNISTINIEARLIFCGNGKTVVGSSPSAGDVILPLPVGAVVAIRKASAVSFVSASGAAVVVVIRAVVVVVVVVVVADDGSPSYIPAEEPSLSSIGASS